MSSLNVYPTPTELEEVVSLSEAENKAAGLGGTGIAFPIFHSYMVRKLKELNRMDSVKEAFKHLEDGAGFISVSEMRHMIVTHMEKITDDDLDQIMAHAKIAPDTKITLAEFEKLMAEVITVI